MDHITKADEYHAQGFGCAQAVLAAFAEDYGLDPVTALRMSTGFGSGMGRMGEVCGALTGGFMVIGLQHGKVNSDGSKYGPATETCYAKVALLAERFKAQQGTIFCKELTGVDLQTPEGRQYCMDNGVFAVQCAGYIRSVVQLLEVLLAEEVPIPA
jgi:C_GCAxxG_C_C family probable redox protein